MLFRRTRCKGKNKIVLLAYQEGMKWGGGCDNIAAHKEFFM